MSKPQFVYAIDVATTPEKLWAALLSNEFWQQFSGPVESDWLKGSRITYRLPDGRSYAEGMVLESDPPHRLSHTWPDPEGEQSVEQAQRMTWQIEQVSPTIVRLTMVHENMTEKAYRGVSKGWPLILGGLKTSLEGATARVVRT